MNKERNKQIAITLWTLTSKEIRRFMRIWIQTLVPPAVTMSLYFVIFVCVCNDNKSKNNCFTLSPDIYIPNSKSQVYFPKLRSLRLLLERIQ